MSLKKTVQIGEPVLREVADDIQDLESAEINDLITDLTDTMREGGMVGMAAPQLGVSKRIFVSEIRETPTRPDLRPDELRVYINPRIINVSHETSFDWEGCGSVSNAGLFGKVERPESITIKYTDIDGNEQELQASGLLARIIQHENDHLDGVMFTDKVDPSTLVSREYYLSQIRGQK